MIIRKGYKYRLYPNRAEQQKLAVQFGHARYIYNWGLAQSQGRYPSSKTCSVCGTEREALPLQVRRWQCPICGPVHDRDVNAAINIWNQSTAEAAGSHAWGQPVRPSLDGCAGRTGKPTRFRVW